MEFHETIKYIRERSNIKQKEIYEGIVSSTTYSRFENGTRELPIKEIEKLAARLGLRISDLIDIQNDNDEAIIYISKKVRLAFYNKLTKNELIKLYEFVKAGKNTSLIIERYYYYIRNHFSKKCSSIPPLNKQEMKKLYNRITSLKSLSPSYLQFILEFLPYFSNHELLRLSELVINHTINHFATLNIRYESQLPDIYFNISDLSIDRAVYSSGQAKILLLENAQLMLDNLLDYQKNKFSTDHIILYRFSRYRYKYYSTTNIKEQEKIKSEIKKFINELTILNDNSPIPNIYAINCIKSLENLLANNLPLNNIQYIIH